MITPVKRVNLSDQVFKQLRDGILGEEYRAGERLPSERELCELLKVNRSSVREALKRLEQARLVEIRHGEGSVVLDFRVNAGFELLADIIASTVQENVLTLRSILEFRSLIGPEIARLAALRVQEEELRSLEGIVEKIEAWQGDDVGALQELDFGFHHALARASENLAFLLILNSVREVYLQFRDFFAPIFSQTTKTKQLYRRILDALKAGDSERARELCAELTDTGNQLFWAEYGHLLEESTEESG